MVAEQQTPGHFNDGRPHGYGARPVRRHVQGSARGLSQRIDRRLSARSSRGFRISASRWPCCATRPARRRRSTRTPSRIVYLGDRLKPSEVKATYTLSAAEMDRFAGQWIGDDRRADDDRARERRPAPRARDTAVRGRRRWHSSTAEQDDGSSTPAACDITDPFGTVEELRQERDASTPTTDRRDVRRDLRQRRCGDDADGGGRITAAGAEAPAGHHHPLTRLYPNAYSADHGLGTVIFRRDASGRAVRAQRRAGPRLGHAFQRRMKELASWRSW